MKIEHMLQRENRNYSVHTKSFNFELTKGSHVLDLGSGDRFLKDQLEEKGIVYKDYDINDLDFEVDKFNDEDDKFDLIISLAVIEHIKNPGLFLSECKRVLKNDSCLYLSTPNWKYSRDTFWNDPTHVKPYTETSFKISYYQGGIMLNFIIE